MMLFHDLQAGLPVSDVARQDRCRRCGAAVLRALVEACDTRVSPVPLADASAELAARARRLDTFDAARWAGRLHLVYRSLERIRAGRGYPVLASHYCGSPDNPSSHSALRELLRPTPAYPRPSGIPPF